jgi:hypothetical protein
MWAEGSLTSCWSAIRPIGCRIPEIDLFRRNAALVGIVSASQSRKGVGRMPSLAAAGLPGARAISIVVLTMQCQRLEVRCLMET